MNKINKRLLIIFCFLSFLNVFSQETIYKYYMSLRNHREAPQFEKIGNETFYVGNNDKLRDFLKNYRILDFYQYVPGAPQEDLANVYVIRTSSQNLADDFISTFPLIFQSYEDMSSDVVELSGYPNDYGLTSPLVNTGANFARKDLDYLNVAQAWDIPANSTPIKIGISDARIKSDDPDFIDKISFVNYSYQNMTYNSSNPVTFHGTSVAAIAALKGNNSYGSVGVCPDCDIVATAYGSYPNLIALAESGVRVINMSWSSPASSQWHQTIVDSLVNHYKVTLVASAGNRIIYQTNQDFMYANFNYSTNSFEPQYTGVQYLYPASYNGVISVGTVEHYYAFGDTAAFNSISPANIALSTNIEDSVTHDLNSNDINNPLAIKYNGWPRYLMKPDGTYQIISPNGIVGSNTMNEFVDIMAPANKVMNYVKFAEENGLIAYHPAGGTSSSAPYVSGTVGLMLGVNECLLPFEVDVILKVTAKDIENMPINQEFMGIIGAGKLEIGKAVHFVNEMKKVDGNATIKNHIFNRFNLSLSNINNKLSIENIVFKDACIADFTAKNSVEVLENCDFKPNVYGFVELKINEQMDISCSLPNNFAKSNEAQNRNGNSLNTTKLYPNPNNGNFSIVVGNEEVKNLTIIVFDILGKPVFQANNVPQRYDVNLPTLASGVYFVKLSGDNYNATLKFIKK